MAIDRRNVSSTASTGRFISRLLLRNDVAGKDSTGALPIGSGETNAVLDAGSFRSMGTLDGDGVDRYEARKGTAPEEGTEGRRRRIRAHSLHSFRKEEKRKKKKTGQLGVHLGKENLKLRKQKKWW